MFRPNWPKPKIPGIKLDQQAARTEAELPALTADFRTGWRESGMLEKLLPNANNLIAADAALHEWWGLTIYRLRGWM
jgi:hypothetical protein